MLCLSIGLRADHLGVFRLLISRNPQRIHGSFNVDIKRIHHISDVLNNCLLNSTFLALSSYIFYYLTHSLHLLCLLRKQANSSSIKKSRILLETLSSSIASFQGVLVYPRVPDSGRKVKEFQHLQPKFCYYSQGFWELHVFLPRRLPWCKKIGLAFPQSLILLISVNSNN